MNKKTINQFKIFIILLVSNIILASIGPLFYFVLSLGVPFIVLHTVVCQLLFKPNNSYFRNLLVSSISAFIIAIIINYTVPVLMIGIALQIIGIMSAVFLMPKIYKEII